MHTISSKHLNTDPRVVVMAWAPASVFSKCDSHPVLSMADIKLHLAALGNEERPDSVPGLRIYLLLQLALGVPDYIADGLQLNLEGALAVGQRTGAPLRCLAILGGLLFIATELKTALC